MNSRRKTSPLGNSPANGRCASRVVAEIIETLKSRELRNALAELLSAHPKYGKLVDDLAEEARWAAIACAMAAYCQTRADWAIAGDLVRCLEFSLLQSHGFRSARRRKKSSLSISEGTLKIIDYIEVFRYVLKEGRRLCPTVGHRTHIALKSVGLLAVKNAMKFEHAMNSGFADTARLLEELIVPVLATAFNRFSNPLPWEPDPFGEFDRSPYGI